MRLGKVDSFLVDKANSLGINLLGGYIRNTDKRIVIGNKIFLTIGNKSRYRLRSRIVWWLHTGIMLNGWQDGNVHHKNGNRIDDRLKNLELIDHKDHAHEHNPNGLEDVFCTCKNCNINFKITRYRLKEKGRGSFCSQDCYKRFPKSKNTRQKHSISSINAWKKRKESCVYV